MMMNFAPITAAQSGLSDVGLLFLYAIPIACVSWTVTHEEVFREPREWFTSQSKSAGNIAARKFFYLFTCEHCFSHYVTIVLLVMTRYTLVFSDWRGYVISGFSLVWIANLYMSIFGRLRLSIASERQDIDVVEKMVLKEDGKETPARKGADKDTGSPLSRG